MTGANCLIFERDVTGHRLQYIRHLAEALLEIGCDVSMALPTDARGHDEYRVHLQALEPNLRLHLRLDPRQGTGFAAAWRCVTQLLEIVQVARADWVYIPFADVMTQAAALRSFFHGKSAIGQVPIEGQVMRGKFVYPKESIGERIRAVPSGWLFKRSPWTVTHVVDPLLFCALQGVRTETEFRLMPEPVESLPEVDRSEARRILGIAADGRYVAIVGGLNARKGIDLLLAAFARARLGGDDRVLLVGKMSDPIRQLVDGQYGELVRQGRLVSVDRYVSDSELGCAFIAADVVAVTHPRQIGSSGTLVRAAAARRPLVASDYGWVGWVTDTFELGTTADVTNVAALAAALEASLASSQAYRQSEKAVRFCQYHTVSNQKAHWVAAIGGRRGIALGDLAAKVDWNWVMEAVEPRG